MNRWLIHALVHRRLASAPVLGELHTPEFQGRSTVIYDAVKTSCKNLSREDDGSFHRRA